MENENENWKICCSNSSSHFIKFFVTFSICFSVMIFSMIQIINNPDKDNSIYFSLISSILALYMDGNFMEGEEVLEYTIEFCQILKFYKTIMLRKEDTDYNAKRNQI